MKTTHVISRTTPIEINKAIKLTGKIFAYTALFVIVVGTLLVVIK